MKISARNQLTGKVSRVVAGAVNNEVELTLEHGEILTTVITKESCDVLGIREGKEAVAIIKAPWVVLANPDCGLRFRPQPVPRQNQQNGEWRGKQHDSSEN